MSDSAAMHFCVTTLPKVSRTFAINIGVLKSGLYRSVLSAYLFCRIVDTVEDAEQLPLELRNRLLDDYIAAFKARDFQPERLSGWVNRFGALDLTDPEQALIADCPKVFEVFLSLPKFAQTAISDCVIEMATGMKKTLNRPRRISESLHMLRAMTDLEEYCHYVAGTVGIMLTRLFAGYSRLLTPESVRKMEELQESFAYGLQLTNIIKDCFDDYRRGWCYIPSDLAAKHQLSIAEFFAPEHYERAQAALDELVVEAAKHLDDALEYTLLLPRREIRIRLFNLWSLFFAIRTLGKAWHNRNLLTGEPKVKISRFEVYATLVETALLVMSNSALRWLYHRLRNRIPTKT